jgi:hypothetical protein
MALHARLKQVCAGLVVRFLFKLQRPAIVHKLFELVRLPSAKFFQWRLDLLFLNVVVLFVF